MPAFSSAGAGRVRGRFHAPLARYRVFETLSCAILLPVRIPTPRVRELRRSQTEAEQAAWHLLRGRKLGAKFRRQCRIGSWVVDFYCFEHRLAIELDGGIHSQPSQMRKDAAKEDSLRTLGVGLLRISNGLVLEDPGRVRAESAGRRWVVKGFDWLGSPSRVVTN